MITENLSTLKIHKLTQTQYDRELEAGRIDENALYLTPDESNPPMHLGVEYRTTEQFLGNTVFTKVVDCGTLIDNDIMAVPHGISDISIIIDMRLIVISEPCFYYGCGLDLPINANATDIHIDVIGNSIMSGKYAVVILKYTKE